MQIQCSYCKNWIEDTVEKCPYCGAANEHLKRYAETTPKTIEELKQWYKDRNLPPEETTRFFIGKDYKAPKAFGIYKDGSKFIVYKNKADGSRAVRYKGPDEAYAVNELYLKLKEEILRQKSRNIASRAAAVPQQAPGIYPPLEQGKAARDTRTPEEIEADKQRWIEEQKRIEAEKIRKQEAYKKKRRIRRIVLLSVLGSVFLLIVSCTVKLAVDGERGDWYAKSPDPVYYLYKDTSKSNAFSVWEEYKYSAGEWSLEGTSTIKPMLSGFTEKDHFRTQRALKKAIGTEIPSCRNSRAFYTQHPAKPKKAYYYADGRLWYYANDEYGAKYGKDRTGWYYYDEDDTDWHYYAQYDDREQVPEELYYDSKDYDLGDNYSKLKSDYAYVFPAGFTWSESSDFKTSDYYQDIKDSENRHSEEVRQERNNDSDYDYGPGDSWDPGGINWDTDW